ncbi:hypothetical protein [Stenotrophomonas sp. CC120223-11]|uniref:hypothetical protein n=1 Tax=Stenotrophomonas sp. CC120223-11 TaxID=1378090 RepID=UPI000BDC84E1|nr:hypothetical protein [Stenotrophomonas sp. CC120223-11]SNY64821.1 hypothetical protein SAMN02744784_01456 [Stenotrophomonas sp. CC120223-11]
MKERVLATLAEGAQEARRHADWLNWVFGITTFGLTLTALQFASPWKIALLCLPIVLSMYVYAWYSFPPTLRALRKLAKEHPKDPDVAKLTAEFEKSHNGLRAFMRVLPMTIAILVYLYVLATGIPGYAFFHAGIEALKA